MSETAIKNVQDLGYRFALRVDGDAEFIEYAMDHIPGFPDKNKIPEEVSAMFKAGCMIRYTEQHPDQHYIVEGDDVFRLTQDTALAGFNCSVGYCVSLPKHEFGALKPAKKHIVKQVRDDAKHYCDVRWSRLLKAANDLLGNVGESVSRAANKLFSEYLNSILGEILKRDRNAIKNGDTSAIPVENLKIALEVFKNSVFQKVSTTA